MVEEQKKWVRNKLKKEDAENWATAVLDGYKEQKCHKCGIVPINMACSCTDFYKYPELSQKERKELKNAKKS